MAKKNTPAEPLIETSLNISNEGAGTNGHPSNGADSKLPWLVEMLPVSKLRPSKRNPRTHSKKQIREIANSLLRFGVINPAVVDGHGRLVAGHARTEAAKLLGLKTIPVIRVTHLSEAEIRAYALADNKLASKAG